MKHAIGAILLIAALLVVGLLVLRVDTLLPPAASTQAGPIDSIFNIQFKLIAFLFALIVGLMVYSIIFFRRKKGDTSDAAHITGNTTLEIVWTLLPLAIVIALAFISTNAIAETMRIDSQAMEVNIIGRTWTWSFEYPAYSASSAELILPVGKQVLFHLSSRDVIHSFWVPEFRVKQDAVPGITTTLRLTPTKIGEFSLVCAELCGRDHSAMVAKVRVVSQADFNAWVAAQTELATAPPEVRGEKWFNENACVSCHSLDGTPKLGPTFLGLYGKQEALESGKTVLVDDAYLYESITDPMKEIVKTFSPAMSPAITANLTELQVQDLIAFIKSLK